VLGRDDALVDGGDRFVPDVIDVGQVAVACESRVFGSTGQSEPLLLNDECVELGGHRVLRFGGRQVTTMLRPRGRSRVRHTP
jgi:hypothetical protein